MIRFMILRLFPALVLFRFPARAGVRAEFYLRALAGIATLLTE